MRKVFQKTIAVFVLVVYIAGLANYLIMNISHYFHHAITHTLDLHHSHNDNSFHGHSHSSFVDYALYIEEEEKSESNKPETTVQNNVNYHVHIMSGFLNSSSIDFNMDVGFLPHKTIYYSHFLKPPFPPPELLISNIT